MTSAEHVKGLGVLNPRRILIVRGGAIGDFILTLPVFQALRKTFPRAKLACLSSSDSGQLAKLAGLADEARNLNDRCWASFFVEEGQQERSVLKWLSSFDCVVSFLHDPAGIWRKNITRAFKGFFLSGSPRPDEKEGIIASEVFLRALEPMGILNAEPAPRIRVPDRTLNSRKIAFHPGSGSEAKNWPEEYWEELILLLQNYQRWDLMIIGGEAEVRRVRRMTQKFSDHRFSVLINEPLTNVARRLAECEIFLGHDSGITHLAAALGIQCVVLWPETNLDVWRPRGRSVYILKDAVGVEMIKPRKVFDKVRKLSPSIDKV